MMDVLEDSLRLCKYPVERIDGSVSSRDRQAAIDRYSKGETWATASTRKHRVYSYGAPSKSFPCSYRNHFDCHGN